MVQRQKKSIIDRVAESQNIADIQAASDALKFRVYKLALGEIELILRAEDIAKASLLAVKTALNDIHNGFLDLSARPNKVNKKDINAVRPGLRTAEARLRFAISELEKKGKTSEYFEALLECKDLIFEINRRLA